MPLRFITQNIRHGGGRRIPGLLEYLVGLSPDVLVITEFHENAGGAILRHGLFKHSLVHQASSEPPPGSNGVLIASRLPFETIQQLSGDQTDRHRWLEGSFPGFGLIASYFPLDAPKLKYWSWYFGEVRSRDERPFVLAGDFNTGKNHVDEDGATFFGSEYMERMEGAGWTDSWRRMNPEVRDHTWGSPKKRPVRP